MDRVDEKALDPKALERSIVALAELITAPSSVRVSQLAEAAIRAYLLSAPPPPTQSGWRTIESAPKDNGRFVPVLLWIDGFNTPDIGGWLDGKWVTPDDYFDITGNPVAWMPLPLRYAAPTPPEAK